jgi:outer membrane protein OmpA-like peptidoglycan-associated protein
MAGITLPIQKDEFKNGIRIIRDDDDKLRIQVTSIIFPANRADFEGLSDDVLKDNMAALKRVADLLNRYKNYRIIAEGHANPTSPPGARRDREERAFILLSEQRAAKIADELAKLGVDRTRITVTGAGTSKLLAPWDDNANNWKNRRVEFILER